MNKSKFALLISEPGQPDSYLQSSPSGDNRKYTTDPQEATGFRLYRKPDRVAALRRQSRAMGVA